MLEKLNTKNDEYTKKKSILKSLQEVVDIKLDIIKNTTLLENYMDFTEKINLSLNDKDVLKQLAHDPFVWNELKKDTKIFKILTDDLQTLKELTSEPELLLEFKKDINILKLLIKDENLLKELVKDTLVFEELKRHNDTLMLLSNNTDILKELVKDHSALETLTKNNVVSIKQQIESGAKTVFFGNFQQSGARYDPIAWRVLDKKGGKILLISELALYRDLTYENFLQVAFSKNERDVIKEVEHTSYFTIKNIYSYIGPTYYADGWFEYDKCEVIQQNQRTSSKTKTKIFSLNIEELEKYFPSENDRIALNSKKLMKGQKWPTEKSEWFLDSTTKETNLPTDRGGPKRSYVTMAGEVKEVGWGQESIAFRPAMWVDINY